VSAVPPEAELRQAFQDLQYAIAIGDLAAVEVLCSAEATMHFQFGQPPGLIVGRPAVVARFQRLFQQLAARMPGPPFVRFKIEEFACLALDPRHAAVFATLTVDGRIGRRTLLYRREREGWRILHLHASNFGPERGPEAA
jgi:SnoaL-like domain